jgi:hypothetical protein
MSKPHSRIRTHPALVVSIVVMLALTWSPVCLAGGAHSFTYQLLNVTETVNAFNPCLGHITGTLTYDGVVHVTEDGDLYHVIVAVHGTALVVPSDPTESFSGPFAEIQTLVLNRNNEVSTFVVTQVGPGGLAFHITFLLVLEPSGVELSVVNVAC